ncbi:MAG TPA: glycosyltransferase family 1 protein [Acidimicrobiaceae bacterium]|nr:glycosyltransferase family 1 protein [Acidimicrobiaceae bacterium]
MTAPVKHLLVTNDFPPKVGGIQVYLWELWRRLDPASFSVLTTSSHAEAAAFDAKAAEAGIEVVRAPADMLLPTPATLRLIRRRAEETGASFLVVDPALPLGLAAPAVGLPYAVVLHGAEVTVPGRLPGSRSALSSVVRRARLAVCAGHYPAAEARRATRGRLPPVVEVPPGVDTARFVPLGAAARTAARRRFGLADDALVVLGVSRLVRRKGFDMVLQAAASMATDFPELLVVIGGEGRDRSRLEAVARRLGVAARLLGRVPGEDLPALYGCADLFVMPCRNRWAGLEQEGFGIVFLEAAATGVAQVAGRSGGSDEAVAAGETGLVVDDPAQWRAVAAAVRALLSDHERRRLMGEAARRRAEQFFDYDRLAPRLAAALGDVPG